MPKTTNYDMFKLREDNRYRIDQAHVRRLMASIQGKNLLELRPISVNKDMEVIDGQHRLQAAKALGIEIYYEVNENLKAEDVIIMNVAKPWTHLDYINYYSKNGYQEYTKLFEFMKKSEISAKIALNICMSISQSSFDDFKSGKFTFDIGDMEQVVDKCKTTIDIIKMHHPNSTYTRSGRFWKPLTILIKNDDFIFEIWLENLRKNIMRMGIRPTEKEDLLTFQEIYNYRNNKKLNFFVDGTIIH